MTIIEQVHDLDTPPSPPPVRPQRLPWVVAAVAVVIAVLTLIPRPELKPPPAPTTEVTETVPWVGGNDFVCRTVADGSVTMENHGGAEPWEHVVTGTNLAVCVWVVS